MDMLAISAYWGRCGLMWIAWFSCDDVMASEILANKVLVDDVMACDLLDGSPLATCPLSNEVSIGKV